MSQPAERGPLKRRGAAPAAILALVVAGCGGHGGAGASGRDDGGTTAEAGPTAAAVVPRPPALERQTSGTTALLQAVSPVDASVVWASGHRGTWARTLDGGATWTAGVVPGADTLQFRDVHAHSADLAWLLSAGPGELSRIYRTDDGGASWTLQWTNPEPAGFYDCLDFWSAERGVVYGDAVDGVYRILRTVDGGASWELVSGEALPDAQLGEGGFAASGTCLVTGTQGRAWIATGNARRTRVLRTDDWGASWTPFETPVPGGDGAGLFSVAFRDSIHGAVFGGSLGEPASPAATPPRVAVSSNGGAAWEAVGQPGFEGAIFGGAWVPGTEPAALVAVAPGGAAWSGDGGATWAPVDTAAYWGLGFASPSTGWLVGPGGRITKVDFRAGD